MKNVLLFHLESLSNLIFQTNQECFPNLRKFIGEAVYYPNYYSTATSTYMVITDLFFGDNLQFEKSKHLEDIFSVKPSKESVFDKLSGTGYKTKCYCYGFKAGEKAKKHVKVYCSKAECWESSDDYEAMAKDLKTFFSKDTPFAVFVQDLESHWMNLDAFSDGNKSSYDLFKHKYKMLDRTFGMVIEKLIETGHYDDTLILAYGDHGDDLWGHGLHEGYTHAIEPFPFLVNCPLIIKNGPYCDEYMLLSTLDLYDLILSAKGMFDCKEKRKFAVSRNLFSGQDNCENSFNKSYMVTDGRYSLLVSAKGLRLYCNGVDAASGRNMLDFFTLKDNRIAYNSNFNHVKSSHYKFFMTDSQIAEFENEFQILSKRLREYVGTIYDGACSAMNFDCIDYSMEIEGGAELQRDLSRRKKVGLVKTIVKRLIGYR